ncbi:alpha/beta hydrolase [Streptomyces sp. NPDC046712]|uniref:alpha/beta hydrolase n=1 Tax=Streptomyces sp. NPDC046712 TaxID=3154802 RepID=UPI0033C7E08B
MTDPLTPAARALCEAMSAAFPGGGSAPALRAAARAGVREVPAAPETSANGVRVRLYDPLRPRNRVPAQDPSHPRPVIVFAHGGGWVLCDLDTHDGLCRELADRTGASVVSVDYRRAPEHRFPAAEDDVYTVLEWAAAQYEGPLFLAGDSSGGNLAAAAALRARDRGGPPVAGQLLFYPALDHRLDSVSAEAYAEGFFHTTAHMRWYWEQYLGPDGDPVAASPGLAPDLAGLPPTLVVLADCDLLRDEGLAYARRLSSAGVRAQVQLHTGVFHGFLGARGVLPEADAALAGAAAWLASLCE